MSLISLSQEITPAFFVASSQSGLLLLTKKAWPEIAFVISQKQGSQPDQIAFAYARNKKHRCFLLTDSPCRSRTYREGRKMNMRQNLVFATPRKPHPGHPIPNQAYLDQLGGCCSLFWSQVGEIWPSWCRIWVLKTAISLY